MSEFLDDLTNFIDRQATSQGKISTSADMTDKNLELFYERLQSLGYNLEELKPILECTDNMLILSGAGSGKTTSLVLKIIRDMITGDLDKIITLPDGTQTRVRGKVLVSTFLKTGAEELSQSFTEWCNKLGIVSIDKSCLTFKTIHAEVYDALKGMGVQVNLLEDTNSLLKQVMQYLHIHSVMSHSNTVTADDVANMACIVSYARNRLDDKKYDNSLMPEFALDAQTLDIVLKTFKQHRQATGKMDFEDMQETLLDGLQMYENVRKFIADRYDYVYVDEFQDTSQLQYEILKYYFEGAKRVICIGDDDQCISGNTMLYTPEVEKPASEVKIGDSVQILNMNGDLDYETVSAVYKKQYKGIMVAIELMDGKRLTVTPDHKLLMRNTDIADENMCLTYEDKSKRYNLEKWEYAQHRDKCWVFSEPMKNRVTEFDKNGGHYFHDTQEALAFIVANEGCAFKIAKDFGFDLNVPDYTKSNKHLTYCRYGKDDRAYLYYVGDDEHIINRIKSQVFYSNHSEPVSGGYFVSTMARDALYKVFKELDEYISEHDIETCVIDKFSNQYFKDYNFVPAYKVKRNDTVIVNCEEVKVKNAWYTTYDGYVYDFEVPYSHAYYANGVLVHNCIYSWRGSDIDIIKNRFEEDYHPTVKALTVNYRCARNILNPVIPSIETNQYRHQKQLRAAKDGGLVRVIHDNNVNVLTDYICDDLNNGRSIGVLGRTNNDLLVPAIILEIMSEGNAALFSLSKGVNLMSRVPKQIFGVIDLLTKRYTDGFEDLLKIFLPRRHWYEASTLASALAVNKNLTLYSMNESDLAYSVPVLYNSILKSVIEQQKTDPVMAYLLMLHYMRDYVYTGQTVFAKKAKDLIQNVITLLVEHEKVSKMTIFELDELFNETLPERFDKRKNSKLKSYIKLTTVHEAKGKEWDSVYIWNDYYGCFPNVVGNREMTLEELEEERRVHYIAWTRAKSILTVFTNLGECQGGFLQECDLSASDNIEIKESENAVSVGKTVVYRENGNKKPETKEETAERFFNTYIDDKLVSTSLTNQDVANVVITTDRYSNTELWDLFTSEYSGLYEALLYAIGMRLDSSYMQADLTPMYGAEYIEEFFSKLAYECMMS